MKRRNFFSALGAGVSSLFVSKTYGESLLDNETTLEIQCVKRINEGKDPSILLYGTLTADKNNNWCLSLEDGTRISCECLEVITWTARERGIGVIMLDVGRKRCWDTSRWIPPCPKGADNA